MNLHKFILALTCHFIPIPRGFAVGEPYYSEFQAALCRRFPDAGGLKKKCTDFFHGSYRGFHTDAGTVRHSVSFAKQVNTKRLSWGEADARIYNKCYYIF